MVKYSFFFILIFSVSSCLRYSVSTIENEIVLDKPIYKLDYVLDQKGKQLIDVNAIYVHTVNETSVGPMHLCLKFDSLGNVIKLIKINELLVHEKDFQIHPNSVDRGKFELFVGNRINLELYHRVDHWRSSNRWVRTMRGGQIFGDTIRITAKNNEIRNYIKVENWKTDPN